MRKGSPAYGRMISLAAHSLGGIVISQSLELCNSSSSLQDYRFSERIAVGVAEEAIKLGSERKPNRRLKEAVGLAQVILIYKNSMRRKVLPTRNSATCETLPARNEGQFAGTFTHNKPLLNGERTAYGFAFCWRHVGPAVHCLTGAPV